MLTPKVVFHVIAYHLLICEIVGLSVSPSGKDATMHLLKRTVSSVLRGTVTLMSPLLDETNETRKMSECHLLSPAMLTLERSFVTSLGCSNNNSWLEHCMNLPI